MRTVTLVISLAVFVTCAVYLVFNLIQKKQGQEFYDNLAKEYFGGISFSGGEQKDDGAVKRLVKISSASKVLCLSDRLALGANVVSGDYDEKLAEMRASLTALSEQNPDTYGWITVPGTNINYPIMQTSDNEFYLDHIYDGSYRVVGSISRRLEKQQGNTPEFQHSALRSQRRPTAQCSTMSSRFSTRTFSETL